MKIEVCKWYKNSDSPVLFFIDDFANLWVDVNGNGEIEPEEDWGYAKDGENSSFRFLKENILYYYPEVMVTFFTPVGPRVGMIENSEISSVSKVIDCDDESKSFFKSINDDLKFEIAYHGTTHGNAGKTRDEFKQEWETYESLDKAVETINKGKEIFKDVIGYYPRGGKYCGYISNDFSDESINETGFMWWCRYWNRGLLEKCNFVTGGNECNPLIDFDLKVFGKNDVVDIPSTVSGDIFTYIIKSKPITLKCMIKFMLKGYLIRKKIKEIDFLLQNKLVISIQEHISPARDDGRRQTPNIFDDRESLMQIFNYLKNKNVWYCTGTELAEYYKVRRKVVIEVLSEKEFKINNWNDIENSLISITVDDKYNILETPERKLIDKENGCFSFKICRGTYRLVDSE